MVDDDELWQAWKRIDFDNLSGDDLLDLARAVSPNLLLQPFSLYRLDQDGSAVQCSFEEWAAFRHKNARHLRFETGPVVTEFCGGGPHMMFGTRVNGVPFAVHPDLSEAIQDHIMIARLTMTLH